MAPRRAYATLVTRSSYLAGVIILAYTLRKHGSQYPLIVLYTLSLDADSKKALDLESRATHLIPREVHPLQPEKEVSLIAERFADTWTKLRVFEIFDYDEVCYLDADMTIPNHNMDVVFDEWMPPPASTSPCRDQPGEANDWLSASHSCVCNLEHDSWAPKSWTPENCPYTHLSHPAALTNPTPITPSSPTEHDLLNGGLFLFRPSQKLWDDLLSTFKKWDNDGTLKSFMFPDQDFLAHFFRGKWRPVPWQFNALKTWRYWHPNIWRDDEVMCLHYIVDKPWTKRIGPDGVAGYKGNDGETHKWWWSEWNAWVKEREDSGDQTVVQLVSGYIVGGGNDDSFNAIGAGVQDFAKKGQQKELEPSGKQRIRPEWDLGVEKEGQKATSSSEAAVAMLLKERDNRWKHKPIGERGHGPVVHKKPPTKQ